MGRAETHVIHIPRWITLILWLAVSAAMVLTIDLMSGHAYHRESSFAAALAIPTTSSGILAIIAPAVADILFFVPWGVLAFLSIDGANRSRRSLYAVTILLGVAFALGLTAWQITLPTRVTTVLDCLWNGVGCAVGASFGHTRKRVRVRFE